MCIIHKYKGFEIVKSSYVSSGGYVLGGRHFIEGGVKTNYNIKYNGKYVIHKDVIFDKLKYAKDEIDRLLDENGYEHFKNK